MEKVHAGGRGNVLSHKNRCLFRMMVSLTHSSAHSQEQESREGEREKRMRVRKK